ncbi:hypothetical protein KVT40_000698 [Elsinoe batatas]|uniref:F-box domain-containing protein n=1 Tax=Elsinoe batatas TaxID=2601811 RepID=A0A8K0PLC9_9PEZI|nr:hypothetical protein KVT40_000698 [Elsinoe batatas]
MNCQHQSPLFRLPFEIRHQIYSYLLLSPSVTMAVVQNTLHPAILSTCRRIHEEAYPSLYSLVFTAHPTLLTSLPYYLVRHRPVPPHLGSRIKRWHILVRLDVDLRFTPEQARDAFTGCDELTVEVMQAMYGSCDFAVLGPFEDVRGVRLAKVMGSLGDGRYGDWLQKRMMLSQSDEGVPFDETDEERQVRELGEGDRGKRFDRQWRLGPVSQGRDVWEGNR